MNFEDSQYPSDPSNRRDFASPSEWTLPIVRGPLFDGTMHQHVAASGTIQEVAFEGQGEDWSGSSKGPDGLIGRYECRYTSFYNSGYREFPFYLQTSTVFVTDVQQTSSCGTSTFDHPSTSESKASSTGSILRFGYPTPF